VIKRGHEALPQGNWVNSQFKFTMPVLEGSSMRINRLIAPLTAATIAVLMFGQGAYADLLIEIDKSTQRMTVTVNGRATLRLAGDDRRTRLRHAERHV
jgi:hypothetical protein